MKVFKSFLIITFLMVSAGAALAESTPINIGGKGTELSPEGVISGKGASETGGLGAAILDAFTINYQPLGEGDWKDNDFDDQKFYNFQMNIPDGLPDYQSQGVSGKDWDSRGRNGEGRLPWVNREHEWYEQQYRPTGEEKLFGVVRADAQWTINYRGSDKENPLKHTCLAGTVEEFTYDSETGNATALLILFKSSYLGYAGENEPGPGLVDYPSGVYQGFDLHKEASGPSSHPAYSFEYNGKENKGSITPWNEYPEDPGIIVRPAEIDFGEVLVGISGTAEVTVINIGGADLAIDAISTGTDFFIAPDLEEPMVVGSFESWAFEVEFQPNERGDFEDVVTIHSDAENADDDGNVAVHVIGEGCLPPKISVDPLLIEGSLLTGETSENTVTITNDGDGDLKWSTDIEVTEEPERDALRGVRRNAAPVGPRRDRRGEPDGGGYFWVDNNEEDGPEYEWFDMVGEDGNIREGAVRLQIANNWNSGELELGFEFPWYREWYPTIRVCENGWFTFDPEQDGTFANLPRFPDEQEPNNILAVNCWDSFPANATEVWFWTDGEGMAVVSWINMMSQLAPVLQDIDIQMMLIRETGTVLYQYGPQVGLPNNVSNVGYENQDGRLGASIIFQDAVPVNGLAIAITGGPFSKWLTVDPDKGTIVGGDKKDVTVTLNAFGLVGGRYEANVHILSNDEDNPDVAVKVILDVTGAPDITVTWDENHGFPNVLDWNLAYAELFSGGSYEMIVNVKNDGSEDLDIEDITCSQGNFTPEPDHLYLEPGESGVVTITFACDVDDSDERNETLLFECNDPNEQEVNVALHAAPSLPPILEIFPASITEVELWTGEKEIHMLELANEGDADLNFTIKPEIISEPERDASRRSARRTDGAVGPRRDDPGDLIAEFAGPNLAGQYVSPVGWDPDNEVMYFTHYNASMVYVWTHNNYDDFEEVNRFAVPRPMDGGWYDGVIYVCNLTVNSSLYRFDVEGENLGDLPMGFSTYGVGFDNEEGLMFARNQAAAGVIQVYEMDGNDRGEQIGTIPNPQPFNGGNANCYNVEWVPRHPDGQLWIANNSTHNVYQILVDTDEWELVAAVQNFPAQITQGYDAVTHDGHHLWVGGQGNADVRIYDDGITEMYWLMVDPTEGTIRGGDQKEIFVTLDAFGLGDGEYVASLFILSNDPQKDTVEVPVIVFVDAAPDLAVEWDEDYGWPDDYDWNAVFDPDLYWGGPYSVQIVIKSTGVVDAVVDSIVCDNPHFTAEPDHFDAIVPGEKVISVLTFMTPEEDGAGLYEGTFEIHNNSKVDDRSPVEFDVRADVFDPPIISLEVRDPGGEVQDPSKIEEGLVGAETFEWTIELFNTGSCTLNVEAEIEMIEEERDLSARSARRIDDRVGPRRDDPDLMEMDIYEAHIPPTDGDEVFSKVFTVFLDGFGVFTGDYEAIIHFYNNDPSNREMQVPVLIHVQGAPVIWFDWEHTLAEEDPPDLGNPVPEGSVVDWNLYYDPDEENPKPPALGLFLGGPYEVDITFKNDGTSELVIAKVVSDDAQDPPIFTCVNEEGQPINDLAIAPQKETVLTFIFKSPFNDEEEPVLFEANMIVTSDASNIEEVAIPLHALASPPPVMDVEIYNPEGVEILDSLMTGETAEFSFNIFNAGTADLIWWTEGEITSEPERDLGARSARRTDGRLGPRRDEPGDLIAEFAGPNVANQYISPAGYDPDNEAMFFVNYSASQIAVWTHDANYEEFEEIGSWAMPGSMDGAWFDGMVYANQHGQQVIQRWDIDGNNMGNVQVPFRFYGVAIDQENGWIFLKDNTAPQPIRVFELDDEGQLGEEIGAIDNYKQFIGNQNPYALEWVFRHPEGQLWINQHNVQQLVQIAVDTEEWQALNEVARFASGGANVTYDGCCHDGHHLWIAGRAPATVRIYDDGITEMYWLMWEPEQDVLVAGADRDMIVKLDAANCFTWDYKAILHVLNNDPAWPDVEIEVVMSVTGIANIDVTPGGDERDEEGEFIDLPIDFGIVYFGFDGEDLITFPKDTVVTVKNVGTSDLEVWDAMAVETDFFYYSDENDFPFVLSPGEKTELSLTCEMDVEGFERDILMFSSNDGREEYADGYPARIQAVGMSAPVLLIDPDPEDGITDTLITGEVNEYPVEVFNAGGSGLWFFTKTEMIEEPGGEDGRGDVSRHARRIGPARDGSRVGPRRDEAGDVIDQFQSQHSDGYQCPGAWDWDNEWMWIVAAKLNWIWAVDPANDYELVTEWRPGNADAPGQLDCAWLDGVIYSRSDNNVLQKWNADGEDLGVCNLRFTPVGVAADVEEDRIFVSESNGPIHVFDVAGEDWEEIGQIGNHLQFHGNVAIDGIEWVPKHPGGQLWMQANGRVYQIAVDTDEWTCTEAVQDFPTHANSNLDGVGHDGHNLWSGACQVPNILIYDDGITEMYWIGLEPNKVTKDDAINPGSGKDLFVTLNAVGAIGGLYRAEIHFFSNDPVTPEIVFPVTMYVVGVAVVNTAPVFNPLPDAAEFVEFPNAFVDGYESHVPLTIINEGTVDFTISELIGTDEFRIDLDLEEQSVVLAQSEIVVNMVFSPAVVGAREGVIGFICDAENEEVVENNGRLDMVVHGVGELRPIIGTDPADDDWIHVNMLLSDEPEERTLVVSNAAGDSRCDLEYEIGIEEVEGEEGRDAPARSARRTDRRAGPRRDQVDLEGKMFAVIQGDPELMEVGWAWMDNKMMDPILDKLNPDEQGDGYHSYRVLNNAAVWDDIAFEDYDAIVVGMYGNLQPFNNGYNANYERFCEYIAGGGAAYFETSSATQPQSPGGIRNNGAGGERHGRLVVSPNPQDENYSFFADICHESQGGELWEEGHIIRGANDDVRAGDWTYSHYNLGQFEDNDEIEWFQVIAVKQNAGTAAAVAYGYGNGTVLTQGGMTGLNWTSHRQPGQWGSIAAEILFYLMESGVSWVEIDASEGTVAAGEDSVHTLTFNAEGLENNTDYYADMSIESNDPEAPVVTIHLHLKTGARPPVHFVPERTTRWVHELAVTDFTFNFEPVTNGWEIGAYTPGNLLAGGAAWWLEGVEDATLLLNAYGDDPETGEVDGFGANEEFAFLAWDPEADEEFPVQFTLTGHQTWRDGGESELVINAYSPVTQEIPCERWSMISLNVSPLEDMYDPDEPRGPDIWRMVETFRNDQDEQTLRLLKNEIGQFCYPYSDPPFNNIPFWNLEEGYWVNVTEPVVASWDGIQFPPDWPLSIDPGWNIVAYYPTYPLIARAPEYYVVGSLVEAGQLILAKNDNGEFMYPARGFSNMRAWDEGEGYQINLDVEGPIIYSYPPEEALLAADVGERGDFDGHWATPASTGGNMSVLVMSLPEFEIEGSQVAAFNTSDRMVGMGRVVDGRCGLAVWGDDQTTELIDGMARSEAFELRLWDADREVEVGLTPTVFREGSKLTYETNGFVALDVEVQPELPAEFYLTQNYPNPFNAMTKLSYGLPEAARVSIRVYDLAGRPVTTLVNGEQEAGHYTAVWNSRDASTGVYIVRMESAYFNAVRKVMLVK